MTSQTEAILASISEAFVSFDRDWRYTMVSERAVELLRRKREELVGKRVWEMFPELLGTELEARFQRTMNERVPEQLDFFYATWNRWFEARAYPAEGGISVFFTDITERKRIEAALQASEQKFRRIFETANEGIWILDEDARVVLINPRMTQMLGYSEAEMLGRSKLDFVAPEERERVREHLERRRRGVAEQFEVRFRHKEGHEVWALMAARPIFENERFQGTLDMVTDITKRKEAERALRQSEERYRTLFNTIDEGFCIIEVLFDEEDRPVDFRFLELNPSFEKQTGLVKARGKRMRELVPNHELFWFETYGKIALTGEPARFQSHAEELNRWFDVYAFRFGEPGNRQVAILFNDISERRHTEDSLAKAKVELERHARNLEETVAERTAALRETIFQLESFSYSITHDMRGPLRAMTGYAQALEEDYGPALDENARSLLQRISAAAIRLDRLIQDVLTYSRLARGDIPLQRVDLALLVKDILREYPNFKGHEKEISVDCEKAEVRGNLAALTQCVSNLLDNALKFVPPGVTPRVRIWCEARGGNVRFWLEDNGIGIAPRHQRQIFGVFQKLHRAQEYSGTGIGLAIVQKAIERMGGSVGVESEPGRGSRFWFELPRAQ